MPRDLRVDGVQESKCNEALESSELDMVVAGTETAVLMVESEANELTEDQMLGAVLFAHQEMQVVIKAVNELKAEAGKPGELLREHLDAGHRGGA